MRAASSSPWAPRPRSSPMNRAPLAPVAVAALSVLSTHQAGAAAKKPAPKPVKQTMWFHGAQPLGNIDQHAGFPDTRLHDDERDQATGSGDKEPARPPVPQPRCSCSATSRGRCATRTARQRSARPSSPSRLPDPGPAHGDLQDLRQGHGVRLGDGADRARFRRGWSRWPAGQLSDLRQRGLTFVGDLQLLPEARQEALLGPSGRSDRLSVWRRTSHPRRSTAR